MGEISAGRLGEVGVQGGGAVEPGCFFDPVCAGPGFDELQEASCSSTESWARPGTKRNVEDREASRFQPRWTRSRMCGLGQCSNRTLWKSWFSR